MKTIDTITIIALLCLICNHTSYAQDEGTDKKTREEVNENTAPFSLEYFSKNKNSFYVISAHVNNGVIQLDEKSNVQVVGGKLPYQRGNFKITMLDAQGETLGDYTIQDPLLLRSCEEQGKNNLSYMTNGDIMIPMPRNNETSRLLFTRNKKEIGVLDIKDLFRKE